MKSLKILSIVSLLQVFTGALTAQVIEDIYGVPNYMVPKTTIAPIIDGIWDPIWRNVAEIPQTSMCNGDVSNDHADIWGFSRVMWDDSFMYLFLRTQDDINWTASVNSWENDSWELFFDGDNSKGTAYDEVNDLNIRIGSEDLTNNQLDVTSYFNTEGMEFENRMAEDGTGNYILEMKIPLANLFIDPNAGSQFGFQIHQNDADGGISYREACTKWWSDPNNYSWNNPSTLGTAMLWDREVSEYLDIHKITIPPIVDGFQDDIWKFLPVFSMNSYDNGNAFSYGDEDLYGWFQLAWDDNSLYGYFSTTDDVNYVSSPDVYANDCWEIYFDGDYSKGSTYDGINDTQLRFKSQYSNDLSMIDCSLSFFIREGVEYVNRMIGDGTGSYILEFSIPLQNVYIDPEISTYIGFEAHQSDGDDENTPYNQSVSKWWEETGNNSWNNPSTFGTAVLIDDAISPPIENHSWSINLNIQENERPQSNLVRSFGGDALATPGYDQGFDAFLPPSPQSFYAYFEIDEFPNHLSRDIRSWTGSFDSSIAWTLKTVNADNQNIWMFWSPSELPSQGGFKLMGDGIDMDMRSNHRVSFNGNQTLTIQYSSSLTVTYSFTQPGWYMVSLPVIPADSSVNSLFPSALGGVAYTWEQSTETYQPVSFMVPQKGYWLAIPGQTTSQVTGKALSQFTEHFNTQGWYMIGCPRGTADFTNPNDYPDGMVLYPAYGWDVFSGNYTITNQLTEKNAYWIAVFGGCSLTIGNNQGNLYKTDSQMKMEAFQNQYGKEPPGPPNVDWETKNIIKKPDAYALLRNYPNPFNPETRIGYHLPKAGNVQLVVYDMMGRPVRTLINGFHEAGVFEAIWDGKDERNSELGSGVYVVKMRTEGFSSIQKLLLVR